MHIEKEMMLFFKKATLFVLPFLIIFSFLILTLYFSGELISIDEVIKKQSDSKDLVLFGLAYSNPDKYYKYNSVIKREPKVLALGTSRIMQFRSKFFKNNVFFNAGGAIGKIRDYEDFVDNIPEDKEPEIIIISLDQYFFNPNWDSGKDNGEDIKNSIGIDDYWKKAFNQGIVKRKIYEDYFNKKINFLNLIRGKNEGKIGLSAIENNSGFRNDGSYYYGKIISNPEEGEDYGFKDTLARIQKGTDRFEHSKRISEISIKKLENFLKKCKDRNIYVIGFMPPYAHLVYETMKQTREKYEYVFNLEGMLIPLFRKFDFDLYNFTDLESLGAFDDETIDGFHGSEKAYLRLHINIAENNQKFKQYSGDLDMLKRRLNNSENNYTVFGNNEY